MIVSYKELLEHFGGSSAADLAVRLKKAKVSCILGKQGKPFTTETALNRAMGIKQPVQILPEEAQQTEIKVL